MAEIKPMNPMNPGAATAPSQLQTPGVVTPIKPAAASALTGGKTESATAETKATKTVKPAKKTPSKETSSKKQPKTTTASRKKTAAAAKRKTSTAKTTPAGAKKKTKTSTKTTSSAMARSAISKATSDTRKGTDFARANTRKAMEDGASKMKKAFSEGARETQKMQDQFMQFGREASDQLAQATNSLTQGFNDAAEQSRYGVEAIIESGNVTADMTRNFTNEAFRFANEAFSDSIEISKEIFGCKTINDVYDMQNKMVRSNLDHFFNQTSRMSDMMFQYIADATEPLNQAVSAPGKKSKY